MVSNIHQIELYINKQLIELESQDKLNIRINNVLWSPAKVVTQTGEYSYSFNIPSTPNNDRILDYANNFAKLNKFHTRYDAQLYADGDLIFDGSLTIKKYDGGKKMYQCNLVNIKSNTLEEIFGDSVMTDMEWMVDFSGSTSIESVNWDTNSKYYFPLVCYGAFQKNPKEDYEGEDNDVFTSNFVIDGTNTFFLESFYPSLNMVETIKKCFESKGYSVQGDALSNYYLNEIYCSTSLAEGQVPTYNVGNSRFGSIKLRWKNRYGIENSDETKKLKFPYYFAGYKSQDGKWVQDKWNFEEVTVTNLLDKLAYNFEVLEDSTMIPSYREGDTTKYWIEVPADGFYRITLSAETMLDKGKQSPVRAKQWTRTREGNYNFHIDNIGYVYEWLGKRTEEELIEIPTDIATAMPFEIQIVKGDDPSFELIKGKYNYQCLNGNPNMNQVLLYESQRTYEPTYTNNHLNLESCFPHEQLGRMNENEHKASTEDGERSLLTNYLEITNYDALVDTFNNKSTTDYGYANIDGTVMCYDPAVSKDFICGFTTMGNKLGSGAVAFIKNGYSWSNTSSEKNYAFYKQDGYVNIATRETSDLNANTFENIPRCYYEKASTKDNHVRARVDGMVYLKKGEHISPYLLRRALYGEDGALINYKVDILNMYLSIEAATQDEYSVVRNNGFAWDTQPTVASKLNLFNFTNEETKVSDWLSNIGDAFNFSYSVAGNTVTISFNKGIDKDIMTAIDLDDRVNSEEMEAEYINYPKEMSVQYNIDDEEHGFMTSVPSDKIDLSTWKDYADRGYSVIKLNDDAYETSSQNKKLEFGYTWYDNFDWENYGTVRIPVIAKEEYMIDNIRSYESQGKRFYSLPQRFWFRKYRPFFGNQTTAPKIRIFNDGFQTMPAISVFECANDLGAFLNLSYKNTEKSLLTEFFDIHPLLASNYITVEAYITPQEYKQIKGGALVKVDDDLYYTSQITGFDPSGFNKTKLKLVKKS